MQRAYDPLTFRFPRSLAETDDTRFRWWTAAAAEEAEARRDREELSRIRRNQQRDGLVALAFAALVGLLAVGAWFLRAA